MNGSLLPLLRIAPSKTDEERILPCSPELTAGLARLITFVSIDGRVPLRIRRDEHERTFSVPLPHLFQLREAGRSRVLSHGSIRLWLLDLANDINLQDVDCDALYFTPRDFRRLCITDIVNAGFPIHPAAQRVGHRNLDVTCGPNTPPISLGVYRYPWQPVVVHLFGHDDCSVGSSCAPLGDRDCPLNGVSGPTRRRSRRGRLVTDDRDT